MFQQLNITCWIIGKLLEIATAYICIHIHTHTCIYVNICNIVKVPFFQLQNELLTKHQHTYFHCMIFGLQDQPESITVCCVDLMQSQYNIFTGMKFTTAFRLTLLIFLAMVLIRNFTLHSFLQQKCTLLIIQRAVTFSLETSAKLVAQERGKNTIQSLLSIRGTNCTFLLFLLFLFSTSSEQGKDDSALRVHTNSCDHHPARALHHMSTWETRHK